MGSIDLVGLCNRLLPSITALRRPPLSRRRAARSRLGVCFARRLAEARDKRPDVNDGRSKAAGNARAQGSESGGKNKRAQGSELGEEEALPRVPNYSLAEPGGSAHCVGCMSELAPGGPR